VEETVAVKGSGNLVFYSALVMSFMGVGLSMFSLSRLQSSSSLKVSAFRWVWWHMWTAPNVFLSLIINVIVRLDVRGVNSSTWFYSKICVQ